MLLRKFNWLHNQLKIGSLISPFSSPSQTFTPKPSASFFHHPLSHSMSSLQTHLLFYCHSSTLRTSQSFWLSSPDQNLMGNRGKYPSHFASCCKSNHHSPNPSALIILWTILYMDPRQALVFGYEGSCCEHTPPSTLHPSARNFIHSTSSPKLSNCRIASSCSSGKPKCFHFSFSSAMVTMPLEESLEQNHSTTIRTPKTRMNLRTQCLPKILQILGALSPQPSPTHQHSSTTLHI